MVQDDESLAKQIEEDIRRDLRGSDNVTFLDWLITSAAHLVGALLIVLIFRLSPVMILIPLVLAWLYWALIAKCHPSKASYYRLLALGSIGVVAAIAAFLFWQHKSTEQPFGEVVDLWADAENWSPEFQRIRTQLFPKKEVEEPGPTPEEIAIAAADGEERFVPNIGYRDYRTIHDPEPFRGHVVGFGQDDEEVIMWTPGGESKRLPLTDFSESSIRDILALLGSQ